ncbi:MAG: tetratricopeptide repeat protein [Candidatus Omnitrophica bacterium]|nr:tetratricopeptide repeat protein [Candidatus Omnitrophota bacterium]MDD5437424.1 tetratricopeptide repeat protein [Candidatus Omnitrophota bacterium]
MTNIRRPYIIIFFLAFALRLIYLNQIVQSPFFNFFIIDEFEYNRWAKEILSGKLLWSAIPYHGPLYPYLLAGLYKIFGCDYYIARLFGGVISSLSCVLMAHISWKSCGKRAGIIAGVIAAVYWPFIFWSGELVTETLAIFLNLIVFLLLWRARSDKRPGVIFLAGLSIGISAATRPNITALVPFVLVWIFMISRRKAFLKNALILISGMAVIIAPIALRHYLISGEFVLLQGHSGLGLFLGLNPHIDTIYNVRAGLTWDKWMLEPIRANMLSENSLSRYWIQQVILIISQEPLLFLKHIGENILLILSRFEICADKAILYNRNFSPLIFSLPGFWLVGPLGLGGAVLMWKKRRELALHYIFLAGTFLTLLPFLTSSRHRLFLVALLLIFAAFALDDIWRKITSADRKGVFYAVCILLIACGIVNIDILGVGSKEYSRTHLSLAEVYLKRTEPQKALSEIKEYIRLYPSDAEGYKALGDIYLNMKDRKRAESAYRKALKKDPEYFRAANNIGTMLAMNGDLAGARRYFKRALVIYPFYDEAARNLKRCEEMMGRDLHM